MTEQDAIAQEAAWEAKAETLNAEARRLYDEHAPRIERLEAELNEATEELESLTAALSQQRSRLWDRIWDSREARGEPIPLMVAMGRQLSKEIRATPFLNRLRAGNPGETVKMEWGHANAVDWVETLEPREVPPMTAIPGPPGWGTE